MGQQFTRFGAVATALVLGVSISTQGAAMDERPTTTIDLGSGINIDLPTEWPLRKSMNPMAEMPDMRKMGVKAHDWRADTGTMRIAITYMLIPAPRGAAKPDTDGSDRKALLARSMAGYLPLAQESAVEPVLIDRDGLSGAYGTLHAKTGMSFPVFFGRIYSCVTTAVVTRESASLTISVGSADCDSAEHRAAVAALAGLHI